MIWRMIFGSKPLPLASAETSLISSPGARFSSSSRSMRSINDLSCAPAMPPTSGMIPLSSVAAAPDGSRTHWCPLLSHHRQARRDHGSGDLEAARGAGALAGDEEPLTAPLRIAVIGGGLAAAVSLLRAEFNVDVYE